MSRDINDFEQHPNALEVGKYVSEPSALSPQRRLALEAHLDRCSFCAAVSDLVGSWPAHLENLGHWARELTREGSDIAFEELGESEASAFDPVRGQLALPRHVPTWIEVPLDQIPVAAPAVLSNASRQMRSIRFDELCPDRRTAEWASGINVYQKGDYLVINAAPSEQEFDADGSIHFRIRSKDGGVEEGTLVFHRRTAAIPYPESTAITIGFHLEETGNTDRRRG